MVKIFIDSANLEEIKAANALGVVRGVTTNPSLIAKEGRNFEEVVREICAVVDGPISAEVVSTNSDDMVAEAKKLSKIHKNIIIKVPICAEGLKAVNELENEGIRTNVTLIFSANQALLAAKAGASYVSPFVGRLDDIGHDGMDVVADIVKIFVQYGFETEVIVASIRHPMHVLDAAIIGADIATIPYKILMQMIKHPLSDIGIVKFLDDWKEVEKL